MNEHSQSDLTIPKTQTVPSNQASPDTAPDPFDPTKLRLSPNLGAGSAVKKLITTIPVRKPSKEWFVRCHLDAGYRLETNVLELKEDNETYLVAPDLWADLAGESTFSPRALVTAINTGGTLFIWPIRLPNSDGRQDNWSKSATEAVNFACSGWVRVQANMSLGAYEVYGASGALAEPEWPTVPFGEILKIAFRDRYIDSISHPVLRRLRGEV
jgi:hypothetical protein